MEFTTRLTGYQLFHLHSSSIKSRIAYPVDKSMEFGLRKCCTYCLKFERGGRFPGSAVVRLSTYKTHATVLELFEARLGRGKWSN